MFVENFSFAEMYYIYRFSDLAILVVDCCSYGTRQNQIKIYLIYNN